MTTFCKRCVYWATHDHVEKQGWKIKCRWMRGRLELLAAGRSKNQNEEKIICLLIKGISTDRLKLYKLTRSMEDLMLQACGQPLTTQSIGGGPDTHSYPCPFIESHSGVGKFKNCVHINLIEPSFSQRSSYITSWCSMVETKQNNFWGVEDTYCRHASMHTHTHTHLPTHLPVFHAYTYISIAIFL